VMPIPSGGAPVSQAAGAAGTGSGA
jgi:hypothetical protein